MARVELPSKDSSGKHNWVEYRDRLMAGDRFAVQDAVFMEVGGEERRSKVALGMQNDLRNALLGRIITAWSFPAPIPSANSAAAADVVIGNAMDLEDYVTLEQAIEPLMDLINGRGLPDPKKRSRA
jgi:hypothetical protein